MIFQDVLELSGKCDVSPTVEKAKKPNRTIKKTKERFVDSMYTLLSLHKFLCPFSNLCSVIINNYYLLL